MGRPDVRASDDAHEYIWIVMPCGPCRRRGRTSPSRDDGAFLRRGGQDFVEEVALGLIRNDLDGVRVREWPHQSSACVAPVGTASLLAKTCRRAVLGRAAVAEDGAPLRRPLHRPKYASSTKARRKGDTGGADKTPRLKLNMCRRQAARYYCHESSAAKGPIVACCGPKTHRLCMVAHVQAD